MAAGLGFKDFQTGEVLTAADVDGYLMQGVWVFASATARDAAVTSPQEGNFAYLKDTNVTTYYTGSAWANLDTTGMTNPMTTTGDTIYSSSGSTPARLGIGTAGQVLQVNSGATAPEWATPASGGGLTLISETVASALSSLSFSSLGSYKQLLLMYSGIRHSDNSSSFGVRFNNDSSAIYHNQGFTATGGNGATVNIAGNSPTHLGNSSPTAMFAFGQGTNNAALVTDCQGYILIDNYTSSTKGKTVFCVFQYYDNGAGSYSTKNGMSYYDSTSAITSLDVVRTAGSGTFSNTTNTTIRLYGVA
jgi:hypothetical protein